MANNTQFDLNLSKYSSDSVFIVFQYDGFELSRVIGVFNNRPAAQKLVELQTKSKEGLLKSHYLREFEVKSNP
jgi:hypothetical protein